MVSALLQRCWVERDSSNRANALPRFEVVQVLHELEEGPHYKALSKSGDDLRFERFQGDVGRLRTRCFRANTTLEYVRHELDLLQRDCFGSLAPFRSYLTRALDALKG